MSTTLVKNTVRTSNSPQSTEQSSRDSGRPDHVTNPKMRSEYRLAQSASGFCVLPDDLKPLILNQSGEGVFNLGLTCKYWNLEVRGFLTENPQGQKILRERFERRFYSEHGMSVVNAFRSLQSTSFQRFFDFDDSISGKECIKELQTSKEPVYLVPPSHGHWITFPLKSALASRACKMTVIEIDEPDNASVASTIEAIQAIPSKGFAVLIVSSRTLSLPNVAGLWDAISSHPIVAHIECNGTNAMAEGDDVVAWINVLSTKNSNVSSFALNNCRLDEQNRETLSALFSAATGILELEVSECETSEENLECLAGAVRTRNAGAGPRLKLHFSAANLGEIIDASERSGLANSGICFREPGQLWDFRGDFMDEMRTDKDSSHEDSSSVVSDPSSGDEASDSEFDSSTDES